MLKFEKAEIFNHFFYIRYYCQKSSSTCAICHDQNVFVLQKILWNTNFRYVQLFTIKKEKKKHLLGIQNFISFLKTNMRKISDSLPKFLNTTVL